MQPTIFAALFEFSRIAFSMSAAGLALLVIGLLAAKNDIAQARGLDKIVALTHLCFAIPLAVFGAEHLSGGIPMDLVPPYMPWRLFWVYFVGFALIAASLSIATKHSGALVRPAVRDHDVPFCGDDCIFRERSAAGGRISWTIVIREMSFGGGGWVLAGVAMGGIARQGKGLITVGRVLIAIAAIFFGVQHFLHPLGLPGVPL